MFLLTSRSSLRIHCYLQPVVILLSRLDRLRLKKDERPSGFKESMRLKQVSRVHDFKKKKVRHQNDSQFLHLFPASSRLGLGLSTWLSEFILRIQCDRES
jgi:hypothetical protein